MPENYEELARRCEEATGADRGIDAEIASLMHSSQGWHAADCLVDFTASTDAAITLVPLQMQFGVGRDNLIPGPEGWAWVSGDDDTSIVKAATPALALCAASLRARAAEHHRSAS